MSGAVLDLLGDEYYDDPGILTIFKEEGPNPGQKIIPSRDFPATKSMHVVVTGFSRPMVANRPTISFHIIIGSVGGSTPPERDDSGGKHIMSLIQEARVVSDSK